jgi:hypothetical protein
MALTKEDPTKIPKFRNSNTLARFRLRFVHQTADFEHHKEILARARRWQEG